MPGMVFMTALRVPLILQQTVPFIALFAGMTTLIGLNRRYELVVVRAAGVSVWQFMLPFCIGALLLGLFAMLAINPLAAWGQRQALNIEATWRQSGGAATSAVSVPWIRQISGTEDTIIGAKSMVDGGRSLFDVVMIHFDSEGRIILRQDAASAKL
ncbi:putative permease YjgP/YjgQ family protein [compost metagenome]